MQELLWLIEVLLDALLLFSLIVFGAFVFLLALYSILGGLFLFVARIRGRSLKIDETTIREKNS